MKASRVHALAALLMVLVAPPAGAPIIGIFSGLWDLIRASDAIIVGFVMTGPATPALSVLGESREETVSVSEVLKGTLRPRAKLQVQLRTLNLLGDDDFRIGKGYVLFLKQHRTVLELVNVSGSAFPIAVDRGSTVSLDAGVRGRIALLLNDLVSDRKERAAVLERQVSEYLSLP